MRPGVAQSADAPEGTTSESESSSGELLDPARADLDGDGAVTKGEAKAFELLLGMLTDPVLVVEITRAYLEAPASGAVDLSGILDASVSSPSPAAAGAGSAESSSCTTFIRGDANSDGAVQMADAVFIQAYLFQGGPPPSRFDAADSDDNGSINLTDSVRILNWLYRAGPPPPLPFPYPGLDPTPDSFEPECDLDPGKYADFHTFFAENDVTSDGVQDPLYIVPADTIEIDPLDSTLDPIVFATISQGTLTAIAATTGRRVYALTDTTAVWAFLDTDGDGVADATESFEVPSVPLDAVLIDTDTGVVGMVTLHDEFGVDVLRLWRDNDSDGFIDALVETVLGSGNVQNPRGLTVDRKTARLFVSGEDPSLLYPWNGAVFFYEDTDGDKLPDSVPSGPPYLEEDDVLAITTLEDAAFLGIHFEPEARKLLVLADALALEETDPGRLVVCAQDRDDLFYEPESAGIFYEPLPEEANALYAKLLSSGSLVAWVTLLDFVVAEYEDQGQDCSAEVYRVTGLPGASERSADDPNFVICTVFFNPAVVAQRTVFNLWNVKDECPAPVPCSFHTETHQIWRVYTAENRKPICPSGWQNGYADAPQSGFPAAFQAEWSDGDNTRATQIRARYIWQYTSGPSLSYCCYENTLYKTKYKYEATVHYGPGGGLFPFTIAPLNGGTFWEQASDCDWELGDQSPKKGWDPTGWHPAPAGLALELYVAQKNLLGRQEDQGGKNGGRSHTETADQVIQVSVQCK